MLRKTFAAEEQDDFLQELRALQELDSPRLTRVLDAGRDEDGHAYLEREFVEGRSLRDALPRTEEQLDAVFLGILDALEDLHRAGLIHGDLKAENILVADQAPTLRLTDFGLSGSIGEHPVDAGGSAYTMPPEVALGWPCDPRSDLFSLGVVAYELLGGELPEDPGPFYAAFPARPFLDCVPPLPEDRAELPLLRALLAVDPDRRPADVEEVRSEWLRRRGRSELRAERCPVLPGDLALRPSWEELRQQLEAEEARWVWMPAREDDRARLRARLRAELALLQADDDGTPRWLWTGEDGEEDLREWATSRWSRRDQPGLAVVFSSRELDAKRWPWAQALPAPRLQASDVARALAPPAATEDSLPPPTLRLARELVARAADDVHEANRLLRNLHEAGALRWAGGFVLLSEAADESAWDRARPDEPPLSAAAARYARVLELAEGRLPARVAQLTARELGLGPGAAAELHRRGRLRREGADLVLRGASSPSPHDDDASLLEALLRRWEDAPSHRVVAARLRAGRDDAWDQLAALPHDLDLGAGRELLPALLQALEDDRRSPSGTAALRAGRLLARLGHPRRAAELMGPLLEHRFSEADDGLRACLELGNCCLLSSDLEQAERAFRTGRRRAKSDEQSAPFVRGLADVALRQGRLERARRILEASARKPSGLGGAARAEWEVQLARVRWSAGAAPEAVALLEGTVSRARREADPGVLAMALTQLALALRRAGRPRAAFQVGREALDLHESLGNARATSAQHRNLGIYAKELGRDRDAEHHLRAAIGMHEDLGELRELGLATASLGLLLLEQGRVEAAEPWLRRAQEAVEHAGQESDRAFVHALHLRWRASAGHWKGLRAQLEAAIERSLASGRHDAMWEASLVRAERALGRRDLEQVHEVLSRAKQGRAPPPRSDQQQRLAILELALRQRLDGPDDEAWGRLRRRFDHPDAPFRALPSALVQRLWSAGSIDPEHLQEAETAARDAGARLDSLRVLATRVRSDTARGDRHGAEIARRSLAEVLTEIAPSSESARRRVLVAALQGIPRSSASSASENPPMESQPSDLLRTFLNLNKRLSLEGNAERLLEHLIDTALDLTGAERGSLLIRTDDQTEVRASRSLRGSASSEELDMSFGVIERALLDRHPILTSNASQDPRFRERTSVRKLELRSVLCVPFRVDDGVQGAVYVDQPWRERAFGDRELDLLDALGDLAGIALRNLLQRSELERLNQELGSRVRRQSSTLARARRQLGPDELRESPRWLGESEAFRKVGELLERFARAELPVLVLGESGTGKEEAARRVHDLSARAEGPFVSESCSAIPENLLEAEFFGVRKGAYTGADQDRPGLFVLADGGTLFLDEIGDLPAGLQAKLLRVLQEGAVRPLGSSQLVPVNVRIVSATHRELFEAVQSGDFREDLYYRICGAQIRLPALRDRGDDVLLLARAFLEEIALEHERPLRWSKGAEERLRRHDWPGNVRELRNEVQRAFALSDSEELDWSPPRDRPGSGSSLSFPDPLPTVRELEAAALQEALHRCEGDKQRAARMLGISRASVYDKIRRYGLEPGD